MFSDHLLASIQKKKHDDKNTGVPRGNSNWGNMKFAKSENSY